MTSESQGCLAPFQYTSRLGGQGHEGHDGQDQGPVVKSGVVLVQEDKHGLPGGHLQEQGQGVWQGGQVYGDQVQGQGGGKGWYGGDVDTIEKGLKRNREWMEATIDMTENLNLPLSKRMRLEGEPREGKQRGVIHGEPSVG